ncbi:MAG: carboxypeptidase-like regulatory domain-containing protein, partial [Bacteroidota bacterium]
QGNGWTSVPENLGTVINSVGDEITPYYDGLSLYFSSNWHLGMGTYDVFRTELVNNRPNNLFHMGSGINSSRDDYGFVYDPARNIGFVVSNRIGGRGNEDVYRITPAGNSMAIVVRSASDGTPVASAVVDFTACGDKAYLADINGRYNFTGVAGLNCQVTVSKDGYAPATVNLNISSNNQTGDIPVLLNKLSESYQGQVINAETRLPVAGARIVVVNRSTGGSNEAFTDANGGYGLAMQPYNTYDISITAQGYEAINFPLAMGDGSNRNVLGVLSLLPGQGISPQPVNPGTINPGTGGTTSGFAVQMASVSKAPAQGAFNSLSDLGQVYTVQQGNAYKVRMGIFQTRAEAEAAKAALAKRGYPGSFIVTDSGAAGAVAAPTNPPGTLAPANNSATGPYYVQLGAYSTPRFFDSAKAQSLGTLVQRQRGNLTLMLILAPDVNTAQSIKERARAQGFKGAFVVQDVNGTIQKL